MTKNIASSRRVAVRFRDVGDFWVIWNLDSNFFDLGQPGIHMWFLGSSPFRHFHDATFGGNEKKVYTERGGARVIAKDLKSTRKRKIRSMKTQDLIQVCLHYIIPLVCSMLSHSLHDPNCRVYLWFRRRHERNALCTGNSISILSRRQGCRVLHTHLDEGNTASKQSWEGRSNGTRNQELVQLARK